MNRRSFFAFSGASISIAALAGLATREFATPRLYLRPPGSVDRFDSLCIKCGQCVQVCPYHSINLLGIDDGMNLGTAFIDPNSRGCYLCDLFPCVLACPSGALNHDTTEIKDVHMGIAVVSTPQNCYAASARSVANSDIASLSARKTYNEREDIAKEKILNSLGKTCNLCEISCPVSGALRIENVNGKNLPVIYPNCVGCGVCDEVCFANVIEIIPNSNYDEVYKENR